MFMGTLRRIPYTTHKSEFLKRMECRMYLERIFEELLEKISRNFFKWSWSLKFLVTKYPLANDSAFHQILNLKLLFECIPKVHSWSCILQSLFCNEPINIKLEEKIKIWERYPFSVVFRLKFLAEITIRPEFGQVVVNLGAKYLFEPFWQSSPHITRNIPLTRFWTNFQLFPDQKYLFESFKCNSRHAYLRFGVFLWKMGFISTVFSG